MSKGRGPGVWAVVPAAGMGRRLGGEQAKQYLEVDGKPLLEHSVRRLVAHPWTCGAVVVLPRERGVYDPGKLLADSRILSVAGGETRADSVLSGLGALDDVADSQDWVLVHDAARPCLSSGDLDRLLRALIEDPVGGILGVPVADTLKRCADDGTIRATVDRAGIWQAQTPQMFRLGPLRDALAGALLAGVGITDEASAMEWAGHRPRMVSGSRTNIKVTFPEDLLLAEALLRRRDGDA